MFKILEYLKFLLLLQASFRVFFVVFFVNRVLSITFTSKSIQTANANLYYVTKFPLYLSFTVNISTRKLVVSRNFLSIRIVFSCF